MFPARKKNALGTHIVIPDSRKRISSRFVTAIVKATEVMLAD
jgi:hypothetical protein